MEDDKKKKYQELMTMRFQRSRLVFPDSTIKLTTSRKCKHLTPLMNESLDSRFIYMEK